MTVGRANLISGDHHFAENFRNHKYKMNSKLYVGNLSYSTTEEALQTLFSQAGTVVSVDLIMDRLSGRSKGYAFIVMSNSFEGERSIDMFNAMSLDNREIRVSFVHRRDDRQSLSSRETGQSLRPYKQGRNKQA